jgi:hypothetical protein
MHRLTALVVAGLTCCLCTAAPAGDEIEDVLDLARAVERTQLRIKIDDMPLAAAVDELAVASGLSIRADWELLRQISVRPRDLVTLHSAETSLATVLADLLARVGDEFNRPVWEVSEGRVVITTARGTEPMRMTDVYDVRDVLGDRLALDLVRSRGPAVEQSTDGTDAPEPLSPAGDVVRLITDHVDAEGWVRYGGSRNRIDERAGRLIVSATPRTHLRIQQVLRTLRWTNPRGLVMEAAIIDVPDADAVPLERMHDAGTASLARALVDHAAASSLWSSSLAGRPGEPIEISSQHGATSLELALGPEFDQATGELVIDVRLRSTTVGADGGDDTRSLTTSVHVPTRNGAVIVELPASGRSDVRRLLVIEIERR